MVGLPMPFHSDDIILSCGPNPDSRSVWAPPLSLAATDGIEFSFFSSRYLDVSIP